ncbi:MAG: phosphatidylserine decarboxylase family protein [Nitrospirota bacterium]
MFKLAHEGYPFVIVFGLITLFTYFFIKPSIAVLPLGITLFLVFFFRDPERRIPEGEGLFVSPADGEVILVNDVYEPDYLRTVTKEISIFMSPFDVHVNRAPCDGIVSIIKYSPGKFVAAYKDESSIINENIVMVLEVKEGRILVRQVAGVLARRVVCRAKVGDRMKRGERYGIIKFGSRLDVYLPKNVEVKVKLGNKVKAGETVIAAIKKEE